MRTEPAHETAPEAGPTGREPGPAAWITGSGMVASALAAALVSQDWRVCVSPHSLLALEDATGLEALAQQLEPELVLHTAALTRVDYCQEHPAVALRANGSGTVSVVEAARSIGAQLIYISTDYVFNGRKDEPWVESDDPCPINVYGESKLAGERAVLDYEHGHVIRTSGVFGPRSDGAPERNFFRAVAERLLRDRTVSVVSDQVTAVTHAPQLAAMVMALLGTGLPRIVHLVCAGADSWYGWARQAAGLLGKDPSAIHAVETAAGTNATPRPRYSLLASELPLAAELIGQHPAGPGVSAYYAGQSMNWYP